jgi:hypothetical protein
MDRLRTTDLGASPATCGFAAMARAGHEEQRLCASARQSWAVFSGFRR